MTLAQYDQFGLASQACAKGRRFAADLARALTATRKPQINFAIELVLQEMLSGFGLRAVTVTVSTAITDAANDGLAFDRHHVPLARVWAFFALLRYEHTSRYSNSRSGAWLSTRGTANSLQRFGLRNLST
jgi:hypothetical protein